MAMVEIMVSPELTDDELNLLFHAAWPGHGDRLWRPLLERSLFWVGALETSAAPEHGLVGFVNVVGDGGRHAFLLDTTVHPDRQRGGLGRRLVGTATAEARARGAEWLHVDYEPHLAGFYEGCGFRPTRAGLLRLT